ncbi:MAG: reverse transcriptase/maturase family protein [Candidatus Paceibacterota bacterium]|jgi:retron-type reverse transcriptase
MRKQFTTSYEEIISVENLLAAWQEFLSGKRNKLDVQVFQLRLMGNILSLHQDLENFTYVHGGYTYFKINDPKPRDIHKANVRDRLLCHAVYRKLYPFFDSTFISDSYSCRLRKGTHRALKQFEKFGSETSKNCTHTCWVLKCDIRKFFANIDHKILFGILAQYVPDENVQWLLEKVISSFEPGLPLGNLTSQLLVNIYMNEFDQYVKHKLKVKQYIRYADDFVFLSDNRAWLEQLIPQISDFLNTQLNLSLHPKKVSIATLASGVDFLGWVHFPDHQVLRTATKKRMFRNIAIRLDNPATMQSYRGLLQHGNTHKLQNILKAT